MKNDFWLLLILVFLVSISHFLFQGIAPRGDEGNYLMIALSIWRDGDVNLYNNFHDRQYLEFTGLPLEPHAALSRNGKLYSIHLPGVPLLISGFYALGGRKCVICFINILSWISCVLIYLSLSRYSISRWVKIYTIASLSISIPLIMTSGMVYPEVFALASIAGILYILSPGSNPKSRIIAVLILCLLPWLHVKYCLVSLLLYVYICSLKPRLSRWFLLTVPMALISAGFYFLYQFRIFGDPLYIFKIRSGGFINPLPGMAGLLFDRQAGLIPYAPALLFSLHGMISFHRIRTRSYHLIFICFLVMAAGWIDWHGGESPPGRYLMPFLPLLALDMAVFLENRFSSWMKIVSVVLLLFTSFNTILLYREGISSVLIVPDGRNQLWHGIPPLEYLFPSFLVPSFRSWMIFSGWILLVLSGSHVLSCTNRSMELVSCRRKAILGSFGLMILGSVLIARGASLDARYFKALQEIELSDTKPGLLAPDHNSGFKDSLPILRWTGVPGADRYYWRISFPDNRSVGAFVFFKTFLELPDSALPMFDSGPYRWQITPYKKDLPGSPSREQVFYLEKSGN